MDSSSSSYSSRPSSGRESTARSRSSSTSDNSGSTTGTDSESRSFATKGKDRRQGAAKNRANLADTHGKSVKSGTGQPEERRAKRASAPTAKARQPSVAGRHPQPTPLPRTSRDKRSGGSRSENPRLGKYTLSEMSEKASPRRNNAAGPRITRHDNPDMLKEAIQLGRRTQELRREITRKETKKRRLQNAPPQAKNDQSVISRNEKPRKNELYDLTKSPEKMDERMSSFHSLLYKKEQIAHAKSEGERKLKELQGLKDKSERQTYQSKLQDTKSGDADSGGAEEEHESPGMKTGWCDRDECELTEMNRQLASLELEKKALDRTLNERENDELITWTMSQQTKGLKKEFERACDDDGQEQIKSWRKFFTIPTAGAWANLTAFNTGNTIAAYLALPQSPWIAMGINTLLWTLFEPTPIMLRTVSVTSEASERYLEFQTVMARTVRDFFQKMGGIPASRKYVSIDPVSREKKYVSASEKLKELHFLKHYLRKMACDDLPFAWYTILLSIGLQLGYRKDLWVRFGIGLASGACTMANSQLMRKLAGGKVIATRSSFVWRKEATYLGSFIEDIDTAKQKLEAESQRDTFEYRFLEKQMTLARANRKKARAKSNPVCSYGFEMASMWSKKGRGGFVDLERPGRRSEASSAFFGKAITLSLMSLITFYWALPYQKDGEANRDPVEEAQGNLIQSIGFIFLAFQFRQEISFMCRLLMAAGKGMFNATRGCSNCATPRETIVTDLVVPGTPQEVRRTLSAPEHTPRQLEFLRSKAKETSVAGSPDGKGTDNNDDDDVIINIPKQTPKRRKRASSDSDSTSENGSKSDSDSDSDSSTDSAV